MTPGDKPKCQTRIAELEDEIRHSLVAEPLDESDTWALIDQLESMAPSHTLLDGWRKTLQRRIDTLQMKRQIEPIQRMVTELLVDAHRLEQEGVVSESVLEIYQQAVDVVQRWLNSYPDSIDLKVLHARVERERNEFSTKWNIIITVVAVGEFRNALQMLEQYESPDQLVPVFDGWGCVGQMSVAEARRFYIRQAAIWTQRKTPDKIRDARHALTELHAPEAAKEILETFKMQLGDLMPDPERNAIDEFLRQEIEPACERRRRALALLREAQLASSHQLELGWEKLIQARAAYPFIAGWEETRTTLQDRMISWVHNQFDQAVQLFQANQLREANQYLEKVIEMGKWDDRLLDTAEQAVKLHANIRDRIELERAQQAAPILQEAQDALLAGEYGQAYGLAMTILEQISPKHVEALAIKNQIEQMRDERQRQQLDARFEQLLSSAQKYFQERRLKLAQDTLSELNKMLQHSPVSGESVQKARRAEIQTLMDEIKRIQEAERQKDIERRIEKLWGDIQAHLNDYHFESAKKVRSYAEPLVKKLDDEMRMTWNLQFNNLDHDLDILSVAWARYCQAREHLSQKTELTKEDFSEMETLLEQVGSVECENTVLRSIQAKADRLWKDVVLGTWRLDGNLGELKKQLIKRSMSNPDDLVTQRILDWVQIQEIVQMNKKKAWTWYIASLVSVIIFSALFIYAVLVLLLNRPAEPLSYLTPLYTFITGIPAFLFFKQAAQADQKLEEEQKRLRSSWEAFGNRQIDQAVHLADASERDGHT